LARRIRGEGSFGKMDLEVVDVRLPGAYEGKYQDFYEDLQSVLVGWLFSCIMFP
jgi:hypothetical protein